MSIFDEVMNDLGLGSVLGGALGETLGGYVAGQIAQRIPMSQLPMVRHGARAINDLLHGDIAGALNEAVNAGVLNRLFDHAGIAVGEYDRFNSKTEYLAYKSLFEHEQLLDAHVNMRLGKKNLFLIEFSDEASSLAASGLMGGVSGMGGMANAALNVGLGYLLGNQPTSSPATGTGLTSVFNLLAADVSYSAIGIEGDKVKLGSSVADRITGATATEVRVTTFDDENGTIKRWFKAKASQAAHSDGTVGVMSDYLLRMRILHSFVDDEANQGGFEETLLLRPNTIEHELSRREQAVSEFTMTFTQIDTFME